MKINTIINNIRLRGQIDNLSDVNIVFPGGPTFSSDYMYKSFVENMEGYSFVIIDLPNHDQSMFDHEVSFTYSIDLYIKIIQLFVKKYHVSTYHLIGHSLGGLIALSLAAKVFDTGLKKIILISTPFFLEPKKEFFEKKAHLLEQFDVDREDSEYSRKYLKQILPLYFDKVISEDNLNLLTEDLFTLNTENFVPDILYVDHLIGSFKFESCNIFYISGVNDLLLSLKSDTCINNNIKHSCVFSLPCAHFPMLEIPCDFFNILKKIQTY